MKIKIISFFVIMVTITSPLYGASTSEVDKSTASVQSAISGFEAFKASAGVVVIPGKIEYDYASSLWLGGKKIEIFQGLYTFASCLLMQVM